MDAPDEATGASGNAASLAAAVLDEEAARQEAQARAKEQVIFPDDMLPGVESDPVSFGQAFAKGGDAHVRRARPADLVRPAHAERGADSSGPSSRTTFHISNGTVVFIGTASGLFFALGAIPLGWLADRMKRVPIVGVTSLLGAGFTMLVGALRSARSCCSGASASTGITKANDIAVHPSLIADNYPIGIRARMSAVMNLGQQVLGNSQPAARRSHRHVRRPSLGGTTRAGAGRSSCSASRPRSWRAARSS